jgi:predicted nucleic acid-binding protein
LNTKKCILDSYAVLALIADEPGAQIVADVLQDETAAPYLSAMNLGEVYYIVCRRHGEAMAEELVGIIRQEEGLVIAEVTWPRIREAARIKAGHRLAYADAFVLGLAQELDACLVTGDPEIRMAAVKLGVELVWLDR